MVSENSFDVFPKSSYCFLGRTVGTLYSEQPVSCIKSVYILFLFLFQEYFYAEKKLECTLLKIVWLLFEQKKYRDEACRRLFAVILFNPFSDSLLPVKNNLNSASFYYFFLYLRIINFKIIR